MMIKSQREPERIRRKMQPDMVDKIRFFNQKFKVIFRHAYTLMDQVLQCSSDPSMIDKTKESQVRLKELLEQIKVEKINQIDKYVKEEIVQKMKNAQTYAKIFDPLINMYNYMETNAKIANYRA